MSTFQIRVGGNELIFSAAHFITLEGDRCESLHGHNYAVEVMAEGPLGDEAYVVDFLLVRDAAREILAEFDHHVLLPTNHRKLRLHEEADHCEVRFRERRWVFPRGDCALLPVANTTAEVVAELIARRLLARLLAQPGCAVSRLRVELEEYPGMRAACELRPDEATR